VNESITKKYAGTVRYAITRTYGSGITFSFGLDSFQSYDDNDDVSRIARDIAALVLGQMERFEAEELLSLAGKTHNPSPVPLVGEDDIRIITSGTLLVTRENGKVTYRWKAAPYEKYGVPVYPEVLSSAGINIPDDAFSIDMHGLVGRCLMKDGKVVKVVKIFTPMVEM